MEREMSLRKVDSILDCMQALWSFLQSGIKQCGMHNCKGSPSEYRYYIFVYQMRISWNAKMAHKHTQYSEHFIQTHPTLGLTMFVQNGGYSELCLLNCEHTQKTDFNLWVKERP